MTFEEAKRYAVQFFGPGTTLHKDGSGWCHVQDFTGKTIGRGKSWLEALREAAAPLLEKERQEREAEAKKEQAQAVLFTMFLREHHKEAFEKWVVDQRAREAAALEEARKNDAAEAKAAEEQKPNSTMPSPIIAP